MRMTDINLTFEPIPDDKSLKDLDEGMDYDQSPKWLDDVNAICEKEDPDYEPQVHIREYDEDSNTVCLQITCCEIDYFAVEEKIEDYLKKKFPNIDISVSGDTYDHIE
tara:strand:+ start:2082 stop:2405 length:324 start_codon:yes stop_codon:yes gene_type:complete